MRLVSGLPPTPQRLLNGRQTLGATRRCLPHAHTGPVLFPPGTAAVRTPGSSAPQSLLPRLGIVVGALLISLMHFLPSAMALRLVSSHAAPCTPGLWQGPPATAPSWVDLLIHLGKCTQVHFRRLTPDAACAIGVSFSALLYAVHNRDLRRGSYFPNKIQDSTSQWKKNYPSFKYNCVSYEGIKLKLHFSYMHNTLPILKLFYQWLSVYRTLSRL